MSDIMDQRGYIFGKYCKLERWCSYWHQLNEITKLKPTSILEVGIGDKTVGNYLKNNLKISYTSVDKNNLIQPDVIADIKKLPFLDNFFDVACAFEVLEHLPFSDFSAALRELGRVSKKSVIISMPHWGRLFTLKIKLPFFKLKKIQFKLNLFAPKHNATGHHWEIGKKGYSAGKIESEIIKSGFKVAKDYVIFESPYHHIYILEKN